MPNLLINQTALLNNYRYLQQQCSGLPICPVVKGDAYGLGAALIAPMLSQAGARLFFTAHFDEALELRALPALEHCNIAVLNGFNKGMARDYIHHHITPVFNSIQQIEMFRQEFEQLKDDANKQPPQQFIHIDSGMNRLGIPYDEALNLCQNDNFMPLLQGLNVTHILSHYLTSDNPASDYNSWQCERLKALQPYLKLPMIVANSAGIMLGKDYQFDAVKPGASLYGIYRDMFPELQHVIGLEAPIIQLNHLKKGHSIGYDATFIAPHNMLTATIECGYADGYLRYGENNLKRKPRHVLIDGEQAPLIGRVSMDAIIADVTDIARRQSLKIAQNCQLIWQDYDINQIAADSGTIPHEFLTFFSKRVKRLIINS